MRGRGGCFALCFFKLRFSSVKRGVLGGTSTTATIELPDKERKKKMRKQKTREKEEEKEKEKIPGDQTNPLPTTPSLYKEKLPSCLSTRPFFLCPEFGFYYWVRGARFGVTSDIGLLEEF